MGFNLSPRSSRAAANYHLIGAAFSGLSGMAMEELAQSCRVARAQELRRRAALARQAASVPTSGSGGVDRVLVLLAEQLERDASLLE